MSFTRGSSPHLGISLGSSQSVQTWWSAQQNISKVLSVSQPRPIFLLCFCLFSLYVKLEISLILDIILIYINAGSSPIKLCLFLCSSYMCNCFRENKCPQSRNSEGCLGANDSVYGTVSLITDSDCQSWWSKVLTNTLEMLKLLQCLWKVEGLLGIILPWTEHWFSAQMSLDSGRCDNICCFIFLSFIFSLEEEHTHYEHPYTAEPWIHSFKNHVLLF